MSCLYFDDGAAILKRRQVSLEVKNALNLIVIFLSMSDDINRKFHEECMD